VNQMRSGFLYFAYFFSQRGEIRRQD